jgi:PEP-CTERM motif
MKRLMTVASVVILVLAAWSPQARADISLQDFGVNINGTAYDYNNLGQPDPTALPGMNATAFSTFTSGDTLGTGLGTLIYTFNPGAAGSYFVNFYFDESAGVPFYNEYGTVNGAPAAGMSWEIAQVNPSVGGIQFCSWNGSACAPDATIFPNALDDTNHVPVGNTNYLDNCTVAPCNADVATALGFNFTLTAGEQAVITLDQSTTNPGGFYLEQVHPVDANNPSATDLFLSGGISIESSGPPPPVPEPGSLVLLGTVLAMFGYGIRRRFTKS